MEVLHWPKSVQLEASPEDSQRQLSNIRGSYDTASQLEETVTTRTTMLHPFSSQVTALQHFKTGFQVEWERFLPTHLIGCSADFFVLTRHCYSALAWWKAAVSGS